MKRLELYTLDTNYGAELAKADNKVMSVSPQNNKQNRPFVGIVIPFKNKKYCVPLSSPKSKHNKIKEGVDFSKIYDNKDKLIAVLNFNNMIPVNNQIIHHIDLMPQPTDSPQDLKYKDLLNNQLNWCNNHRKSIYQKARNVYTIITEKPEVNPKLVQRCCNFKKLEEVLAKYTLKNNQNNPDKYYYIPVENEEQLEKLRNNNIPFKINKDRTMIIVDISDKERAKKCISEIQSKKNQHKPKL